MIVLDASAVVELLLNSDCGAQVKAEIADAEEELAAPHLLTIEVMQVLRRLARTSIDLSVAGGRDR